MVYLPSILLPATVLVAFYPAGRLPASWWRWPVAAVSAGLVVLTLVTGLTQSAYDDIASGPAPVDLSQPGWEAVAVVAGGAVLGGAVTIWVATVVRLVHARPPERQQLAWLLCVVLPLMVLVFFVPAPAWVFVSLDRSEEHTSELQSRQYLVCRLLLEKTMRELMRAEAHLPNAAEPPALFIMATRQHSMTRTTRIPIFLGFESLLIIPPFSLKTRVFMI